MKYAFLGIAAAALWYGAAATAHNPATVQQDRWTWSGRVVSGRTVEIRGLNGSVSAEASTGNDVEVVAEKRARRSDPDEVTIEVVEHAGGVTICAVYPGRRVRANSCDTSNERRRGSNERENDVEVTFTVRVPRGVAFDGNTVNGDVEALGLDGAVDLNTVNGSVRLETSHGDARGSTVNGSINATVRAIGERPLRFSTVNGGITLRLPEGLNADLRARTVNGSVTSDFPISVQGRMNPRRLDGRIGTGGRALEVETVNGSVRLIRQ